MRSMFRQAKNPSLSLSRRFRKTIAEHPCPCHVVCDTLVHLILHRPIGGLLLLAGFPVWCAEFGGLIAAVWCGYMLMQRMDAGGE